MNKQSIIDALRTFARQRPGLDYANYGDPVAYRAELRRITKDLAHAQALLRAVESNDAITADALLSAFDAYSGRLTITAEIVSVNGVDSPCAGCGAKPGKEHKPTCKGGNHLLMGERVKLDYCTGQYWPTEYRRAVCAVAAAALWAYWREAMPEQLPDTVSPGDYLRRKALREFGRGVASRWFN